MGAAVRWPVSRRRARLPRLKAGVRQRVQRVGVRELTIGVGVAGAALIGALPDLADALTAGEIGLPERYEPYRRVLAILLASAAATAASKNSSSGGRRRPRKAGAPPPGTPRREGSGRDDDGAGTA